MVVGAYSYTHPLSFMWESFLLIRTGSSSYLWIKNVESLHKHPERISHHHSLVLVLVLLHLLHLLPILIPMVSLWP